MFQNLRNFIKFVLIYSVLCSDSNAFAEIENDKTRIEDDSIPSSHIINDELCDKQLNSFIEALTIREFWAVKCKISIKCQALW